MILLLTVLLQAPPQEDVDAAVDWGAAWLYTQADKLAPFGAGDRQWRYDELVLLTLAHARIGAETPKMKALIKAVTESPIERTYLASLQAAALAKIDRAKWQLRLAQCAQFLVDNQCRNGQWSYGLEVRLPVFTPGRPKPGTTELPRLPIRRREWGPEAGDNSNAQYALLGLRAAVESAVEIPDEVFRKSREWWEGAMHSDGGWAYLGADIAPSRGSMTAAAVSSLSICNHYLKADHKADLKTKRGLKWIGEHFSVDTNPGTRDGNTDYYWLYGLERAAMLYGTDRVGSHDWYAEGARMLLQRQQRDGSWSGNVQNTCFAILFLRRATEPLEKMTATEGGKK